MGWETIGIGSHNIIKIAEEKLNRLKEIKEHLEELNKTLAEYNVTPYSDKKLYDLAEKVKSEYGVNEQKN